MHYGNSGPEFVFLGQISVAVPSRVRRSFYSASAVASAPCLPRSSGGLRPPNLRATCSVASQALVGLGLSAPRRNKVHRWLIEIGYRTGRAPRAPRYLAMSCEAKVTATIRIIQRNMLLNRGC